MDMKTQKLFIFNNMVNPTFNFYDSFYILLISLIVIFKFPDVLDFMNYKEYNAQEIREKNILPSRKKTFWYPSPRFAIFLGFLVSLSFCSFNKISEFLYFNF